MKQSVPVARASPSDVVQTFGRDGAQLLRSASSGSNPGPPASLTWCLGSYERADEVLQKTPRFRGLCGPVLPTTSGVPTRQECRLSDARQTIGGFVAPQRPHVRLCGDRHVRGQAPAKPQGGNRGPAWVRQCRAPKLWGFEDRRRKRYLRWRWRWRWPWPWPLTAPRALPRGRAHSGGSAIPRYNWVAIRVRPIPPQIRWALPRARKGLG